jgi:hypothetical protein
MISNQIIYELTITTLPIQPELQLKLIELDTATISLTNKTEDISHIELIQSIKEINSQLSIIPYYSLKYHQEVSPQETSNLYMQELAQYQQLGILETLLVSGNPKPRNDSLDILRLIQSTYTSNQYPGIAVAYNPFLQDEALLQENHRLTEKLRTDIISSVYFQIGIDTTIIREAVQFIRHIQPNISIAISLMNPTKANLAKFSYRPWRGVILPPEYLQSSDNAHQINQELYSLAEELSIGIIQGE